MVGEMKTPVGHMQSKINRYADIVGHPGEEPAVGQQDDEGADARAGYPDGEDAPRSDQGEISTLQTKGGREILLKQRL